VETTRLAKTAAALALAAVFVLLCGCATPQESPLHPPQRSAVAKPWRVAVLPPRIHPDLDPDKLAANTPLAPLLLDGRGLTVTSTALSRDIGLKLVSTLTQAGAYERIFTAADERAAAHAGANALMTVTVWDYRTVLLGSNKNYVRMALLSPLFSPYWIRWRTIEARLEWEVLVTSAADGSTLYRKRLKRAYTAPVRSASSKHFINKMLSFLQNQATPSFIGELFMNSSIEESIPEITKPSQEGSIRR
jgi:hypothetical protein